MSRKREEPPSDAVTPARLPTTKRSRKSTAPVPFTFATEKRIPVRSTAGEGFKSVRERAEGFQLRTGKTPPVQKALTVTVPEPFQLHATARSSRSEESGAAEVRAVGLVRSVCV